MGKATRSDYESIAGHGDNELYVLERVLSALVTIVSGKNPDNTDFLVPVDLGGASVSIDTLNANTDGLEALSTSILAKLSADPATQTTLAAILAKMIAAPATEATLAAITAQLTTLLAQTDGLEGFTDGIEALLAAATPAGENHLGAVGGHVARPSGNFTRPNDTTAYALGDLVANNTAAGSVTPISLAISRAAGKGGMVRRMRLRKSGTSITNAQFRIHCYAASPTASNGDNGAWLTDNAANYVGSLDVTVDKVFTDGAAGNGLPTIGSEINFTSDTYYLLIEARGAYTPVAQEVFTVEAEILQN